MTFMQRLASKVYCNQLTRVTFEQDPLRDDGSGAGPAGAVRIGKYKLIKGNPGTLLSLKLKSGMS
jgi:hypothetical protein